VSFQAAALRVVIRLLAAAAMFALAMRVSRGADQTQPIAVSHVPAAGLIRPLVIERSTSTESTEPTAKQQRPARYLQ
jgi:hypothetical protein